jgi:hypothetical protein
LAWALVKARQKRLFGSFAVPMNNFARFADAGGPAWVVPWVQRAQAPGRLPLAAAPSPVLALASTLDRCL